MDALEEVARRTAVNRVGNSLESLVAMRIVGIRRLM